MLDQASTTKQTFRSIDIMRGIAILMVILVHTAQRVEGLTFLKNLSAYGQMGVQLFFVASAFTLCYSLDVRRTNEPVMHFYTRRLFRIAPGYYFGILIFFSISLLLNSLEVSNIWKGNYNLTDILVNVFFLHGLFPSANNTIVPGGWSIGTEMLFYLIFPLLYKFYNYFQEKSKYTLLIVPFVALVFSSLIQYLFYKLTGNSNSLNNNSFIYFSILNQMPVFCIGISLYFSHKAGYLKKIKMSTSLVMLILLTCLSDYLMVQGISLFILVNSFTPFISALSFIFLFIILQNYNKNNKGKSLAKIGVLSYSMYLVHCIFTFYFVSTISEYFNFIQSDMLLIILYILTVVLTYVSSNFTYKFIELKGIQLGKTVISSLEQRNKIDSLSKTHKI